MGRSSQHLAQTERDFELLIVGDGCTDNTAQVVAGFNDPRIRWFDLPKAPHFGYANRNVALRAAQGELVAFMAHDDLVFPDHLAQLSQKLEAAGADWIYSRPLLVSPDGVVMPLSGNLHNADELDAFLERDNFIPASCIVHRRTVLEGAGYWPEDVEAGGDWHLWRRILENGGRRNFAYHPLPTALHFKANWRKSFDPAVTALSAIASSGAWWPPALKVSVGSHGTEQAAISALLEDPNSHWVEDVREGVPRVIERLAWDHTIGCLHRQHGLPEDIASLKHLLTYRDAQLAGLSERLKGEVERAVAALAADAPSPPPEFVELDYLAANPDIAAAVAKGEIPSGFDHWLAQGWRERRALRPTPQTEA